MALDNETRQVERARIARLVLDLMKARGADVSYAGALTESGLSRGRFGQVFEDYDDLFEAIAEVWLAPHMKVMEEVVNADLPPNRKMYEFFRKRFEISQDRHREDPEFFAMVCDAGAANFERVRSFVDLADHYLCEVIVQAQADGYFAGLEIDETLSLINQMVANYTLPDALLQVGDRLSEKKLAQIVDTIFIGLSGEAGGSARGVNTIRLTS